MFTYMYVFTHAHVSPPPPPPSPLKDKRPIDIFLFPSYFIPWCLINVSTNYVVSVNPILDLKFIIQYVYKHL